MKKVLGFLSGVAYFHSVCTSVKLLKPSSMKITSQRLGTIEFNDKQMYELSYEADEKKYAHIIITIKHNETVVFTKNIYQHETIRVDIDDLSDSTDVVTKQKQFVDH